MALAIGNTTPQSNKTPPESTNGAVERPMFAGGYALWITGLRTVTSRKPRFPPPISDAARAAA